MKKFFAAGIVAFLFSSCAPKYGCPTSGSAVGAEKIVGGDSKAMRAAKKDKFKVKQ